MSHKNEERTKEVYLYVKKYISDNGSGPTIGEIAEAFGMAKSTTSKYLTRLINEGAIERRGRYGIQTSDRHYTPYMMPIIGSVACGKPILAVEDIKGYIPLDESMVGGEYFGLVAKGDSMIGAGINDGDIVYVLRRDTCDDGDIVVAMIDDGFGDGSEATLKRFYRDYDRKKYILHPENPELEDIVVDSLRILGVAKRVLKKL